jgi:hypothetical protein
MDSPPAAFKAGRRGEQAVEVEPAKGTRMADRRTRVAIAGEKWLVNGRPVLAGRMYAGQSVEGLLLNSRMVQAVFDDENPVTRRLWEYPDTGRWDADRNTAEFVAAMPAWREHGLDGFTINLQGGSPSGYYKEESFREQLRIAAADEEIWAGVPGPDSQPWCNTAFDPTGGLKPEYLARLARVLDRADELGFVVILGLFYQGQDERLTDEAAVLKAVDNACAWVIGGGYRNVVIEVNNECDVASYEHEILQPERVAELIGRVKGRALDAGARLLAATSYRGGGLPGDDVIAASDFVLLHGNGVTRPERIGEMVRAVRRSPAYRPMPIVFNEDDHYEFAAPENNFRAALASGAGWGFFDPGAAAEGGAVFGNYRDGYQNPPVDWSINTGRKREFFELLREIAESQGL